jgi:protein tyrosine phosphatase (PTP) superfamily phosphohydrolase (DUF442 family)
LKSAFALLLLISAIPFARAEDGSPEIPIARFFEVSPGIYRGARPGPEGLQALHDQLGIKTDIDLDNDQEANVVETAAAEALGIHLVSRPMSAFWAPHEHTVNEIIAIMADPTNYPLFVHCQMGEDRTGMIVGVYRTMIEDVRPKDAIHEAVKHGFHEINFPLAIYFQNKTEKEYLRHHPDGIGGPDELVVNPF